MPFITQTAIGRRKKLSVFGGEYDTVDGTGVRDYIHVADLAKGHVKAVEKLLSNEGIKGVQAYNLGTGCGVSALQMVNAFAKQNNVKIHYKIVDHRPGDVTAYCANAEKAQKELNWSTELTLDDMVKDGWNWQSKKPNSYQA